MFLENIYAAENLCYSFLIPLFLLAEIFGTQIKRIFLGKIQRKQTIKEHHPIVPLLSVEQLYTQYKTLYVHSTLHRCKSYILTPHAFAQNTNIARSMKVSKNCSCYLLKMLLNALIRILYVTILGYLLFLFLRK